MITAIYFLINILSSEGQVWFMQDTGTAPYSGLRAPTDRVELFAPNILSGPFDERMISNPLHWYKKFTLPVKIQMHKSPGNRSNNIYWLSSDIIKPIRPGKCKTEVFKPGIISLENRNEGNLSYSSKFNTFIYRIFDPDKKDPLKLITYSKRGLAEITNQNISIDSEYREWDFNFDRTGKQFYFTSDRPLKSNISESMANSKIWKVAYRNGNWGEPFPLPSPVNLDGSFSGYPAFTDNGLMYFHSNRPGGYGDDDIYTCISANNSFTQLSHPAYPINTEFNDRDAAVSPDGSVIVFFSDRPGGSYADGDLYLSIKNSNNEWLKPIPLGGLIGYAGHPYISDDGKSLFITKLSGTDTDIYEASLKEIKRFYYMFSKMQIKHDPVPISPGTINTADDEVPLHITGLNYLIFSRTPAGFSDWANEPVYVSKFDMQKWSKPVQIENSEGSWVKNVPEGIIRGKLAFSKLIMKTETEANIDIEITEYVSRGIIKHSNPGYPINTEFLDSWPALDMENNLYFFSNRPGGHGNMDLYYSHFAKESYNLANNMGPGINSKWNEHDPAISPDGSILIFASDRKCGFGGDDLYICFKNQNDEWSTPLNLGSDINTGADENRPVFNQEGDTIFFASNTSGNLDILKISLK